MEFLFAAMGGVWWRRKRAVVSGLAAAMGLLLELRSEMGGRAMVLFRLVLWVLFAVEQREEVESERREVVGSRWFDDEKMVVFPFAAMAASFPVGGWIPVAAYRKNGKE